MLRKLGIIITAVYLVFSCSSGVDAGYPQVSQVLCDSGLKLYQQGQYSEALRHFKMALMAAPDYAPALRYIQMMEGMGENREKSAFIAAEPVSPRLSIAPEQASELMQLQREMIAQKGLAPVQVISHLPGVEKAPSVAAAGKQAKIPEMKAFTLDEAFNSVAQPINIQKGETIVITGRNISRFLVTPSDIIDVQKDGPDNLLVTGKNIGYSYLHIWDDNGRWTSEWLGIFPIVKETPQEQSLRLNIEKVENFKLRYNMGWMSFEQGRRIHSFKRKSYSYWHSLNLDGPTPYGNMDSGIAVSSLKTSTDLSYLSLGLHEGKFLSLKDFSLRFFDFNPAFSNITFTGATLRGATFSSPAFHNKLNYSAFWGREGGGAYGNLSPGLNKIKNSFLEGFNLIYAPWQNQNYRFSLLHGWGRDRVVGAPDYTYDWMGVWNFKNWGLDYELANDSLNFADLMNFHYSKEKFNLTMGLRDIDKNFYNIMDRGWGAGELGGQLALNYVPLEKLRLRSGVNVYKDRLYPADNRKLWNEDMSLNLDYALGATSSLSLGRTLNNDLGKLSQSRYQSTDLGFSQSFKLFKDMSVFMNYSHQDSKNFASPSADYINDRIFSGLRISLIGELSYYLNGECDFIQQKYFSNVARPRAWETGIDWSQQLASTPFYGSFRMGYRNEENTDAPMSFMSGEDYIEGYSELTYRPAPDKEIYGSCRMRNVWAENPNINKHLDMTFNTGLRYVWDTGVRWETVCNIEGYIFRDRNSDGLRQRDEAPVEGVKVRLGPDKVQVTDIFGYYKFKNVRGRKVQISLDTSTIPLGYVLTVPSKQEVVIQHHRTSRVDFGIISHTEIFGYVFEDANNNGLYDLSDRGVPNVLIVLDGSETAVTDGDGKYSFQNISRGRHTVKLELQTIPVYYIPKVAISKEIPAFEGNSYFYHIPLKRTQE